MSGNDQSTFQQYMWPSGRNANQRGSGYRIGPGGRKGGHMAFMWESRAIELGYRDSEHMLHDLIINQGLSYSGASKIIGHANVRSKAMRYGIKSKHGRGGPTRKGFRIIDELFEPGSVERMFENMEHNISKTASRLGVGVETLRSWLIEKGLHECQSTSSLPISRDTFPGLKATSTKTEE